ncbi:MAG: cupin domain-containing protein [Pararhodobacter sp.]|nr:cupin domain-containing protein [Pararhodobacter sp.]
MTVEACGTWITKRGLVLLSNSLSDICASFGRGSFPGQARNAAHPHPHRQVLAPVTLAAGDFILIPDLQRFRMASKGPPNPRGPGRPLETGPGRVRLGPAGAPVEMRAQVRHCRFEAPDSNLLVSLLPEMIHVSGHDRLVALMPVIQEETRAARPGRGLILHRLRIRQRLWHGICSARGPFSRCICRQGRQGQSLKGHALV